MSHRRTSSSNVAGFSASSGIPQQPFPAVLPPLDTSSSVSPHIHYMQSSFEAMHDLLVEHHRLQAAQRSDLEQLRSSTGGGLMSVLSPTHTNGSGLTRGSSLMLVQDGDGHYTSRREALMEEELRHLRKQLDDLKDEIEKEKSFDTPSMNASTTFAQQRERSESPTVHYLLGPGSRPSTMATSTGRDRSESPSSTARRPLASYEHVQKHSSPYLAQVRIGSLPPVIHKRYPPLEDVDSKSPHDRPVLDVRGARTLSKMVGPKKNNPNNKQPYKVLATHKEQQTAQRRHHHDSEDKTILDSVSRFQQQPQKKATDRKKKADNEASKRKLSNAESAQLRRELAELMKRTDPVPTDSSATVGSRRASRVDRKSDENKTTVTKKASKPTMEKEPTRDETLATVPVGLPSPHVLNAASLVVQAHLRSIASRRLAERRMSGLGMGAAKEAELRANLKAIKAARKKQLETERRAKVIAVIGAFVSAELARRNVRQLRLAAAVKHFDIIQRCALARSGALKVRAVLYRPAVVRSMFTAVFAASFGCRLRRLRYRRLMGKSISPARLHRCRPYVDLIKTETITKTERRKLHPLLCSDCRRLFRGPIAQQFLVLSQSVSAVRAIMTLQSRFRFNQKRRDGTLDAESFFSGVMCERCAHIADPIGRRIVANSVKPMRKGASLATFLPPLPDAFVEERVALSAKSKKKVFRRRRVSDPEAGFLCPECHSWAVWFATIFDRVARRRQEAADVLLQSQGTHRTPPRSGRGTSVQSSSGRGTSEGADDVSRRLGAARLIYDWWCWRRWRRNKKPQAPTTAKQQHGKCTNTDHCSRCDVIVDTILPRCAEEENDAPLGNSQLLARRRFLRSNDSGLTCTLSVLHPKSTCVVDVMRAALLFRKEDRIERFVLQRWRWFLFWKNAKNSKKSDRKFLADASVEHGLVMSTKMSKSNNNSSKASKTSTKKLIAANVDPNAVLTEAQVRSLTIQHETGAGSLETQRQDHMLDMLLWSEETIRRIIRNERTPEFKKLFKKHRQGLAALQAAGEGGDDEAGNNSGSDFGASISVTTVTAGQMSTTSMFLPPHDPSPGENVIVTL